jgi:hypothetical protein
MYIILNGVARVVESMLISFGEVVKQKGKDKSSEEKIKDKRKKIKVRSPGFL